MPTPDTTPTTSRVNVRYFCAATNIYFVEYVRIYTANTVGVAVMYDRENHVFYSEYEPRRVLSKNQRIPDDVARALYRVWPLLIINAPSKFVFGTMLCEDA